MSHNLLNAPEFDYEKFSNTINGWKSEPPRYTEVEWSTASGPVVFYYPAARRGAGVSWKPEIAPTEYSELYADYIEEKILPRLAEIAKQQGIEIRVKCVDLQPLIIQRQRRKAIAE
jgi:hypothetical protein